MAVYENNKKTLELQGGGNCGVPLSIVDIFPDAPDVHVYDKHISDLSARELRDIVEACQLQMETVLLQEGVATCKGAFYHLFVRFGELAMGAYDSTFMDDESYITRLPSESESEVLFIYTCKGLRTLVDIFLLFFRVVEIRGKEKKMQIVEDDSTSDIMQWCEMGCIGRKYVEAVADMIKTFHIEASLDTFNVLQQLMFLSPAQRLVYSHNFAGMFNDISQVTYFHYPDYVRSPQVKPAEMGVNAMNSLPCLQNLIPDVKIVYDDDARLPFGSTAGRDWVWVVSAKRVFLWDPVHKCLWGSGGGGILDLAAYYLFCKYKLDFFRVVTGADSEESERDQAVKVRLTDFGHAKLVRKVKNDFGGE
eukprot:2444750-Rhodomonas_salina.1